MSLSKIFILSGFLNLNLSTAMTEPAAFLSPITQYQGTVFSTIKTIQPNHPENLLVQREHQQRSETNLYSSYDIENQFLPSNPMTTPLIVILALILLIASQTFINSMLSGDRGLAAFLRDGAGFQKSAFKERKPNAFGKVDAEDSSLSNKDPLPWLKLPELDFVEVKGQERDTTLVDNEYGNTKENTDISEWQ